MREYRERVKENKEKHEAILEKDRERKQAERLKERELGISSEKKHIEIGTTGKECPNIVRTRKSTLNRHHNQLIPPEHHLEKQSITCFKGF